MGTSRARVLTTTSTQGLRNRRHRSELARNRPPIVSGRAGELDRQETDGSDTVASRYLVSNHAVLGFVADHGPSGALR